jgi:hypothetical protein
MNAPYILIRKQIFSEFLNLNCKNLTLLKNFNHVIREILEKDLELSVNSETVNTLKNEFHADFNENATETLIIGKNMTISEDKENINTANINSINIAKNNNKDFPQIRKKNRYNADYYGSKQFQRENDGYIPDHNKNRLDRSFLKEDGVKTGSRFQSYNNRNTFNYRNRNDNFYRNNVNPNHKRMDYKDKYAYSSNFNTSMYEKSIY